MDGQGRGARRTPRRRLSGQITSTVTRPVRRWLTPVSPVSGVRDHSRIREQNAGNGVHAAFPIIFEQVRDRIEPCQARMLSPDDLVDAS